MRAGRVKLNGEVRRDPECPVRMGRDKVEVDGSAVRVATKYYLILNKPRGLVTTTSDEKGRDTIYSCLSEDLPWIAPVGRLDKASEGLLLLTNDSDWAARVLAPDSHLPKTYHVQIAARADTVLLQTLRTGRRTKEGDFLRVRDVNVLRQGERNAWLEIILDEGRNRHIRRLLSELGIEVLRLVRVAIGPLTLGNLVKGKARSLTPTEKEALDLAMSKPGGAKDAGHEE